MKKTILIIMLFVSLFMEVQAQMEMRLSVCVGDERLANLLTDEQKDNVTHLTITGTMQAEDYACVRTMFNKKLSELDLGKADIDTIPAHAFEGEYTPEFERKIVLPEALVHMGDSALCMDIDLPYNTSSCPDVVLVLPGEYPTLGTNVYYNDTMSGNVCIEVASDNIYCKEVDGGIYSADGTTFYFYNKKPDDYLRTDIAIADGTRIISGHAFESSDNSCAPGLSLDINLNIRIPETVDTIGDRAFANMRYDVVTGYWHYTAWPRIYCMAQKPPVLGKDVFLWLLGEVLLVVPDESVGLYSSVDGWNSFKIIRGVNNIEGNSDGISKETIAGGLEVYDKGTYYIIKSNKIIKQIVLYDGMGRLLMSRTICNNEYAFDKEKITAPCTIARISYDDGTSETIRLKP